jgi:hypothetical protein
MDRDIKGTGRIVQTALLADNSESINELLGFIKGG